jgi:hypothetical protein
MEEMILNFALAFVKLYGTTKVIPAAVKHVLRDIRTILDGLDLS